MITIGVGTGIGINALIFVTSFNAGLKDQDRVKQIQKYGILDMVLIVIVTVLFEALPVQSANRSAFLSEKAGKVLSLQRRLQSFSLLSVSRLWPSWVQPREFFRVNRRFFSL